MPFFTGKKDKKKILLVDDNLVQLSMVEVLLKKNYEVTSAKSGSQALDYLIHGLVPDLILLDIIMPNMDGWETFGRLKAISLLHKVPIIFLSSISEKTEIDRAMSMGAFDFISKPFNNKDLIKRINAAISKNE